MANNVELPKDAKLAAKIIENEGQLGLRKQEMGYLGRLFGNATEKPGNIAGLLILLCLCLLGLIWYLRPSDFPITDVVGKLATILTLTVGYLFGHVAKH
jgi:hypothetical protein